MAEMKSPSRLSEQSGRDSYVDELGMDRELLEKDRRFIDEDRIEEGEDEGFMYGGLNVSGSRALLAMLG